MDAGSLGAGEAPVELTPAVDDDGVWSGGWVERATCGFVALGVVLRLTRYLLDFPLWCDETMLAANFLGRDYGDLLRPLQYRQVGPVLFLAVELTAVKVLGFSEWSLRLFPMACGVIGVPLFAHAAGRVTRGVLRLLAVAVFAVSGWPLRYVAEVKPYASDLFVALGLLALALEWRRRPDRVGWLWALAAAAPLAVGLSLPAVFVVGGVGLALLGPVWRSKVPGARPAWLAGNAGAAATFLGLLRFYKTAPQDRAYFHDAWAAAFPPLAEPWRLPAWLLDVHSGFMFAYPDGGARGASGLTLVCVLAGAWVLWRDGRRVVLGLTLGAFGLALLAAAAHRYPYGVSARTTQYAAPAICLLAGLGAAEFLRRIPRPRARRRALLGTVTALALLGAARFALDLVHPYKTASDARARDFARWFWTELSRDGELACFNKDLGVVFDPAHWTKDATDTYLCYRALYSPRGRDDAPDLDAVTAAHPLRCVAFNEVPHESPEFHARLARIADRFDLRSIRPYPVSSIESKRGPTWDELYVVYEFVPKPGAVASRPRPGPARR